MIKVRGYLANMIVNTSEFGLKPRSLRLAFVSFAALCAVAGPLRADDCIDLQSTTPVTQFQPCDAFGTELDLSAPIATQPVDAKPTQKSDSVPWIATDPDDVPATFNTSDTGVSVRTSLGTVRDYNKRSASPTIEQPQFGQPVTPDFTMPGAPVARTTPLDVWTNIDLNGYDGSRDQSARTGVGADYKLNKATSVGVSIERGDARTASTTGVVEDQKASAYVTLQATPLLSFDARTEWQTGNEEFAETSGAAERGAFILAPKINHSFKLDTNGTTLSPYLSYQREFDVSGAHKDGVDTGFDATQSAGAGITYAKPDAYSFSVSADVDNFGVTDDAQSLSSKFQLSVPLNK